MTGEPVWLAAASACYYAVAGPGLLYLAIRAGGGRPADAIRVFAVPFCLSILAIGPWLLLDRWAPGAGRTRDALVMASVVAGSSVSYLVLGRVLQPAGWRELVERIQTMMPYSLRALAGRIAGNASLAG
jgi:hypothetical protein